MSLPTPYYEADGITLYCGDARELCKEIEADVVVTDPPYGINLGDSESRVSSGAYESYRDTLDEFLGLVPPTLELCLKRIGRMAVFMAGRSLCYLPRPCAVGGVYNRAGCGTTAWGFTCFHPVAFYGSAPWASGGLKPNVLESTATTQRNGHPCPKPIQWMTWLVSFCSFESQTVLDPFAGSGTTLRAALDLGRRAIGIEIEEKYCQMAVERLRQRVLITA